MKLKLMAAFIVATILAGCTAQTTNNDTYYAVRVDGKWGYIDQTGQIKINPQFAEAWNFTENGLAAVKQEGKWGYIDKSGKFVIEPQFEFAVSFAKNGLAQVRVNNLDKAGYIDETGKYVIEPQFDKAGDFNNDGLAVVVLVDSAAEKQFPIRKYGVIDETGKYVVEPKYQLIKFDDKGNI